MHPTSANGSSHSNVSDASKVKNLQQNSILSESEEQISLVKDFTKDEAALSEKREDRAVHSYNDDGNGVLPVQETILGVRQGLSETAKISVQGTEDQDQELSEIKLSQNDSSLVEILRNLLNDENSVNVAAPSGSITTADLVSAQGNCASSFEKSAEVLEKEVQSPITSRRLKGYFCSNTVFNLGKKVLTETEIGVLEGGLGFVPTPNLINEENLRRDFSRKMRCKWYFRNELSDNFSEVPAFKAKSLWKPPAGHSCVELFLSKLEGELFSFLPGKPQSYNMTKEEWQAMRNLAEDRSIIIKPADKGSCVVVWDREDYLAEGYKQLSDNSTYVEVKNYKEKLLVDLTEKVTKFLKNCATRKLLQRRSRNISRTVLRVPAASVRCTSFVRFTRDYTKFQDAQ